MRQQTICPHCNNETLIIDSMETPHMIFVEAQCFTCGEGFNFVGMNLDALADAPLLNIPMPQTNQLYSC